MGLDGRCDERATGRQKLLRGAGDHPNDGTSGRGRGLASCVAGERVVFHACDLFCFVNCCAQILKYDSESDHLIRHIWHGRQILG